MAGHGGPLPRPRVASPQPSGPHQAPDPLVGDPVPDRGQPTTQPSHARVAAGPGVQMSQDHGQGRVRVRPGAGPGRAPGVVAGAGHPELGAHEPDRV